MFGMNHGAFLGICLVALAVFLEAFGINKSESIIHSSLNVLIVFFGLGYSIIQYRDNINNGFITYQKSLKLGTTIAFFSSIIVAFYTLINVFYLDPAFIPNFVLEVEQEILKSNPEISDEELDFIIEKASYVMQPHWILILGMLGGTFAGFFYSLIISIFVKKDNPNEII